MFQHPPKFVDLKDIERLCHIKAFRSETDIVERAITKKDSYTNVVDNSKGMVLDSPEEILPSQVRKATINELRLRGDDIIWLQ